MEPSRTTELEYAKRVTHYENDEGLSLLQQLARKRGISATALLRALTREEAQRVGVKPGRPKIRARRGAPSAAPVVEP